MPDIPPQPRLDVPAPPWISAGARMARLGETGEVRQECYVGDAGQEPPDPMEAAAKSAAV